MGENVTLQMIYDELKSIKKELSVVECALIPVVKLSDKELKEHREELETALRGERTDFRALKR